jgi:hypothetical protein
MDDAAQTQVACAPSTDGNGLKAILPQLDEFCSATGERKFWKIAHAMFRISSMNHSVKYKPGLY